MQDGIGEQQDECVGFVRPFHLRHFYSVTFIQYFTPKLLVDLVNYVSVSLVIFTLYRAVDFR